MCFDGTWPSCFTEKMRRARKPHDCEECGDRIEPGERYEYVSGIWDGRPENYATCLGCVSLRAAVTEHEEAHGCYGIEATPAFGYLWESAREMGMVCHVSEREELSA